MSKQSYYKPTLEEQIEFEKETYTPPSSRDLQDAFSYFELQFGAPEEEAKKAYRIKIRSFPENLSITNGHWDTLKKYYGCKNYDKLKQENRSNVENQMYSLIEIDKNSLINDIFMEFFQVFLEEKSQLATINTLAEINNFYKKFKRKIRGIIIDCASLYNIDDIPTDVVSLKDFEIYLKKVYIQKLNELYIEYEKKFTNSSFIIIIKSIIESFKTQYGSIEKVKNEVDAVVELYKQLESKLKDILFMINSIDSSYIEQYNELVQRLSSSKTILDLKQLENLINDLYNILCACINEEIKKINADIITKYSQLIIGAKTPNEKLKLFNELNKIQNLFSINMDFKQDISYFLSIKEGIEEDMAKQVMKSGIYLKRYDTAYSNDVSSLFMLDFDGVTMFQLDLINQEQSSFKISNDILEHEFITLEDALDEYRENNKYKFYFSSGQYSVVVGPLVGLDFDMVGKEMLSKDFNKEEVIHAIKVQLLLLKDIYKDNSSSIKH